jgi:DNA-binding NarL/FixJ family response regulator
VTKLQAKWEAILAAEGLAPLDSEHEASKLRRNVQHLAQLTPTEVEGIRLYYDRCEDHLVWLRHTGRPWRIWALHCQGLGRREIARRLKRPEKRVRTVLERQHTLAGLIAPVWGGRSLL